MKRLHIVIGITLAMMWPGVVRPENAVVVESKAVPPGATGVTIGVYLENDVTANGIVFPLVIREVTPGSYIADTLALDPQNRLTAYLTGYMIQGFFPDEDNTIPWRCSGVGFGPPGDPDFVSPDAMIYAGLQTLDSALPIGDDGAPPGGTPSLRLTFNVTEIEGTFEIDTTCVSAASHLVMMDESLNEVIPSFTKGVITIVDSCACDCHTDPVCDGVHDVLDLIKIISVAYQNGDPVIDPNPFCPYEDTDVNCDNGTNTLDIVLMDQVVNYGADPDSTFCDPCAP